MGNGQDLLKKVRLLKQDAQRVSGIQSFSMRKSSDQQLFLRFPDGSDMGYLSEKLTNALKHLFDRSGVEFEALVGLGLLEDTINRSGKASDAAMRVNINVYGPESDRDDIGKRLSSANLFLQDPDQCRAGLAYINPHIMQFSEIEESEEEVEPDMEPSIVEPPEPEPPEDEEFQEVVAGVFNSLQRGHGLQRIQDNERVKIGLFPCVVFEMPHTTSRG